MTSSHSEGIERYDEIVELFLKRKNVQLQMDWGLERGGRTPFGAAVSRGRLDIIKKMVAKGIDLNSPHEKGYPLYAATQVGTFPYNKYADANQLAILQFLLDNGVDANTMETLSSAADHRDHRGIPLIGAVEKFQPKMVEMLLKAGADVNKRDQAGP